MYPEIQVISRIRLEESKRFDSVFVRGQNKSFFVSFSRYLYNYQHNNEHNYYCLKFSTSTTTCTSSITVLHKYSELVQSLVNSLWK